MEETTGQVEFGAQFDEDRLLAEHFRGKREGFYVEIGAYDGVEGSATAYFDGLGWRGVLVEAVPELADLCRENRPRAEIFNYAVVAPGSPPEVSFEVVEGSPGVSSLSSLAVGRSELRVVDHIADKIRVRQMAVPARTIDQILSEARAPKLDFVTIDVNGHEADALKGFSLERWQPDVVIVERLGHLPDREILGRMHEHGYAFRRTTGVNDWFIRLSDPSDLDRRYKAGLMLRHHLPSYLTLYRPLVRGPVRQIVKRGLARLGLLPALRRLRRGDR